MVDRGFRWRTTHPVGGRIERQALAASNLFSDLWDRSSVSPAIPSTSTLPAKLVVGADPGAVERQGLVQLIENATILL